MRALSRNFLAPLIMAAAVLTAGPAYLAASGPVAHSAAMSKGCPAGTNWDTVLQACV